MSQALRALLEGIVDYAGVFPPASLDVPTAARQYHSYRSSPDAWMLGRFVIGVAKLPELRPIVASLRGSDKAWPVSVVAPDAAAATGVLRGSDDANVAIQSVEVRATTPADVVMLGRATPKGREVYIEIAVDSSTSAMLDAIAAAKLRAKIRTGGTAPHAFPAVAEIVSFIRGCLDRNLPFKATAGLHHPFRGSYRLTYDAKAPSGEMYGYLNVFLATAFMSKGFSDKEAADLLVEANPAAVSIEDTQVRWRDMAVDVEAIKQMRVRSATSFGSCSFREPVEELPYPLSSPSAP